MPHVNCNAVGSRQSQLKLQLPQVGSARAVGGESLAPYFSEPCAHVRRLGGGRGGQLLRVRCSETLYKAGVNLGDGGGGALVDGS